MLQRSDAPYPSSEFGEPRGAASGQIDLMTFLSVARKNWPVIVIAVAVCTCLSILYLATASSRYTASARILIDMRKNPLFQNQQVVGDQTIDAGVVESQVEILTSESVALAVVHDLALTKDPEFVGEEDSVVAAFFQHIVSIFQSLSGTESEGDKQTALERAAVSTLTHNVKAKRIGLTYVVEVTYTSFVADKAARIANAITDAYMVGELDAKFQATKRASKWLQDRIAELRQQATEADAQVQSFKASHDIVDTSHGLISEQQLSDVNSQLILARAATAEAKARYDRISQIMDAGQIPDATISDALHSDVINRVRAQYLDLKAREADWSARYGVNHQATVNLRAQMHELLLSISNEMQRIAQTYKSDYDIAQARETSLESSLNKLVTETGEGGSARVKLRDLESSAQTSRNLYDSFLQKFMEATQQQTFPIMDARVISAATAPQSRSWPKSFLVLGGGIFFGLLSGFGIAAGREFLNRTFHTVSDVERFAGFECLGILPAISASKDRTQAARFTVISPFSRFAEVMRNVKVSIDLARLTKTMKVIGITSSVPREGKTTVAANLARLVAGAGHKVLLIDADLRNPTLTGLLSPDVQSGFIQILSKTTSLEQSLVIDPETGLHFLPVVLTGRISNAAELLSSDATNQLMNQLRERYEYIFLDFAPICSVVDVKAASHLIDGIVMVVEWGKTSHQAVSEALGGGEPLRERMIGIVLNRADPAALKRHETYRGDSYESYYIEGNAPV